MGLPTDVREFVIRTQIYPIDCDLAQIPLIVACPRYLDVRRMLLTRCVTQAPAFAMIRLWQASSVVCHLSIEIRRVLKYDTRRFLPPTLPTCIYWLVYTV